MAANQSGTIINARRIDSDIDAFHTTVTVPVIPSPSSRSCSSPPVEATSRPATTPSRAIRSYWNPPQGRAERNVEEMTEVTSQWLQRTREGGGYFDTYKPYQLDPSLTPTWRSRNRHKEALDLSSTSPTAGRADKTYRTHILDNYTQRRDHVDPPSSSLESDPIQSQSSASLSPPEESRRKCQKDAQIASQKSPGGYGAESGHSVSVRMSRSRANLRSQASSGFSRHRAMTSPVHLSLKALPAEPACPLQSPEASSTSEQRYSSSQSLITSLSSSDVNAKISKVPFTATTSVQRVPAADNVKSIATADVAVQRMRPVVRDFFSESQAPGPRYFKVNSTSRDRHGSSDESDNSVPSGLQEIVQLANKTSAWKPSASSPLRGESRETLSPTDHPSRRLRHATSFSPRTASAAPHIRYPSPSPSSSSSAGSQPSVTLKIRRRVLHRTRTSPSLAADAGSQLSSLSPASSVSVPQQPLPSATTQTRDTLVLQQSPFEGLKVAYADVGEDSGSAVFVFLGLGVTSKFVEVYEEMASVMGLRLICIDRWGIGDSDDVSNEKRGVLEWSLVVGEVADRLGVSSFSILAHSAGAPYAMATALRYGIRVRGPIHLLAPWISPELESGYNWLRYVPEPVLHTAQIAESWMLAKKKQSKQDFASPAVKSRTAGAEKLAWPTSPTVSKPLHETGFAFDNESSSPVKARAQLERQQSAPSTQSSRHGSSSGSSSGKKSSSLWSNLLTGPLSVRSNRIPSPGVGTSVTSLKGIRGDPPLSGRSVLDSTPASATSSGFLSSGPRHQAGLSINSLEMRALLELTGLAAQQLSTLTEKEMPAPRRRDAELPLPPTRPQLKLAPEGEANGVPNGTASPALTASFSPAFATSTTKSSQGELISKRGAIQDLFVILSPTWGFSYPEVGLPLEVWQGDRDERLGMAGIRWLENQCSARQGKECKVHILPGKGHGLLSDGQCVIEVLESLAKHARAE